MDLKNYYPNYIEAINLMKDSTDLTRCQSNQNVLSYGMSYNVYGNKLGDIYIDLNKHENSVYITFATYKGLSEKARTYGEKIHQDLDVEEWVETISGVMNNHNANPDHAQLVLNFTKRRVARSNRPVQAQKSGCVLVLLALILPLIYSIIIL